MNDLPNPLENQLKAAANRLPLTPGVYLMHDASDRIIYIGKAKALKNRVTQYFGSHTNHNEKVRQMVAHVAWFETILCDSEFEAFILENSLIKQHQPKYNILLKDDKGFHYIYISDGPWSQIRWVKQKGEIGTYIGPYNSGAVVHDTVEEVHKIFKLPDCNRTFDHISKPCLNYHLGLCCAPCRGKLSADAYAAVVEEAVRFIRKGGYNKKDLAQIQAEMEQAAERLDFEYAARLRDRMKAVERLSQRQKVMCSSFDSQDIFAVVFSGEKACINVLQFREGRLCDQNQYFFDNTFVSDDVLGEFLPAYYRDREDIPKRIVLDRACPSGSLLTDWLSKRLGKKVELVVPKIGEQKQLVELCRNNGAQALAKRHERTAAEVSALSELAELLHLEKTPKRIESYDISNTAGEANVASMVVFTNGKPDKKMYRKFRIQSFTGQDDYRSMAEVLDRRLSEAEKGDDDSFSVMPDLILLDGGKGQLSAVLPVLAAHGKQLPLFGMVKDNKHRTRGIMAPEGEIALKPTRPAFTLVTQIQDETHRFAITYHRKKRSEKMMNSELTALPGVGPKRLQLLFRHFKTLEAMALADKEELAGVKGIPLPVAETVYRYFHEPQKPAD